MKRVVGLIFMVIVVLGLTACSYEVNYTIHEDGSVDVEGLPLYTLDDMKEMVSKAGEIMANLEFETDPEVQARREAFEKIEGVDELLEYIRANAADNAALQDIEKKEINGVAYLYSPKETVKSDLSADTMSDSFGGSFIVLPDKFEFSTQGLLDIYAEKYGIKSVEMESDEEFQKMLASTYLYFTVKMPEEIVLTNGELSKDKKSAYFEISFGGKNKKYYAYTASSDSIIDLGVDDGVIINKKSIKISTNDKIISVAVNGKKISGKKISLKEDGKYTVEVKTANSEKTVSFTKDSKKPVVTGVENGKTYKGAVVISFSDELSGLKSAKLGKKKVKSGVKVTKPGKYTLKLTDKAGNKTTVKFTIEKS